MTLTCDRLQELLNHALATVREREQELTEIIKAANHHLDVVTLFGDKLRLPPDLLEEILAQSEVETDELERLIDAGIATVASDHGCTVGTCNPDYTELSQKCNEMAEENKRLNDKLIN